MVQKAPDFENKMTTPFDSVGDLNNNTEKIEETVRHLNNPEHDATVMDLVVLFTERYRIIAKFDEASKSKLILSTERDNLINIVNSAIDQYAKFDIRNGLNIIRAIKAAFDAGVLGGNYQLSQPEVLKVAEFLTTYFTKCVKYNREKSDPDIQITVEELQEIMDVQNLLPDSNSLENPIIEPVAKIESEIASALEGESFKFPICVALRDAFDKKSEGHTVKLAEVAETFAGLIKQTQEQRGQGGDNQNIVSLYKPVISQLISRELGDNGKQSIRKIYNDQVNKELFLQELTGILNDYLVPFVDELLVMSQDDTNSPKNNQEEFMNGTTGVSHKIVNYELPEKVDEMSFDDLLNLRKLQNEYWKKRDYRFPHIAFGENIGGNQDKTALVNKIFDNYIIPQSEKFRMEFQRELDVLVRGFDDEGSLVVSDENKQRVAELLGKFLNIYIDARPDNPLTLFSGTKYEIEFTNFKDFKKFCTEQQDILIPNNKAVGSGIKFSNSSPNLNSKFKPRPKK
jgi:hypothetical protein